MLKVISISLLIAASAIAQEAVTEPRIISTASATTEILPDYIEFILTHKVQATTHEDTVEQALAFEYDLSAELEAQALTPSTRRTSRPDRRDVVQPESTTITILRFSAKQFTLTENGALLYAKLLDKLIAISAKLNASITGPILGTRAEESLRSEAVKNAIENAYENAETAANSMQATISAVEKIEILSTDLQDSAADTPRLTPFDHVRTTAKVKVTYMYEPSIY